MTELFLCAECAQTYRNGYEVRERAWDMGKKRKCQQCGRTVYGAHYEIGKKEKERDG